jgi:hypothetical protein
MILPRTSFIIADARVEKKLQYELMRFVEDHQKVAGV